MGYNGSDLWGPAHDLDFWTALHRGLVQVAEARAMRLLSTLCDENRFLLYCRTGRMPAMGNMTKRIYLVRRKGGVDELEDGRVVAGWCISVGPHAPVPGTDNVVAIKCLIEGEEVRFMRIGNRSLRGEIVGRLGDQGGWAPYGDSTAGQVKSPYAASFLRPSEKAAFPPVAADQFLNDPMYDEWRVEATEYSHDFLQRQMKGDMVGRLRSAEDQAQRAVDRIREGLMPKSLRHTANCHIGPRIPIVRRAAGGYGLIG